jgi:peptidoglycan hydrolase CwlO-like protein
LGKVKSEVDYLYKKQTAIEHEMTSFESYKASLTEEINSLEKTTKDLEERKVECDAVTASLSEVKERLASENKRLQIFDSFLGFVKSSAVEMLETFAADAAYFIEQVKNGKVHLNWSGTC